MDGLIQEAKLIKTRYGGHREDTGYHTDESDKGNKQVGPRDFVLRGGKKVHCKIWTFI